MMRMAMMDDLIDGMKETDNKRECKCADEGEPHRRIGVKINEFRQASDRRERNPEGPEVPRPASDR